MNWEGASSFNHLLLKIGLEQAENNTTIISVL
jgi:hypothetical protein